MANPCELHIKAFRDNLESDECHFCLVKQRDDLLAANAKMVDDLEDAKDFPAFVEAWEKHREIICHLIAKAEGDE